MGFPEKIGDNLREFIEAQPMFFVASAPLAGGRVNLSPEGHGHLSGAVGERGRLPRPHRQRQRNRGAPLENGRVTLMFCSFSAKPLILRLYGKGEVVHPADDRFALLLRPLPGDRRTRHLVAIAVDSVQTSCGFAVPKMELVAESGAACRVRREEGRGGDGRIPPPEEPGQHRRAADRPHGLAGRGEPFGLQGQVFSGLINLP